MFEKHRLTAIGLCLTALMTASCVRALHVRGRHHPPVVRGEVVFVGGYYYDPFFGPYPWWAPVAYPRAYFPVYDDRAQLRVVVTPREAAVLVDGFFAGIVDDFDGLFERLPLPPGGHDIALYLEGYRTEHKNLYLQPGTTFRLELSMERLVSNERSELPEVAPAVPPPPPGSYRPARRPPPFVR
jgi:hypothetical protein